MEERGTKTIMSGVLFLDIVEYSKKSVAGQISLKERFNSYLSDAIRDVPVPDRIILDTGDGAAINFLGDIEDALKAALSLRESISKEDPSIDPPLQVRVGINLGPVRLVRDINGQPNIVGDGINVAQRVMGFANINQILVSRSYHDAVSRLSPEYAGMFHFQGSRTDKHVREHEVYAVGHIGEKSTELAAANMLAGEEAKTSGHILAPVKIAWNSAASSLDGAIESVMARFKQASPKQRTLYIGAAAIPVVLIGVLLLKPTRNDTSPPLPDSGQAQAASSTQLSSAVAPAAPAVPQAEGKAAGMAQPVAPAKPGTLKGPEAKPGVKKAGDQGKHPATPSKPKTTELSHKGAAPAGAASGAEKIKEAYIAITCKEGTQLFVDGAEKGKAQLGDAGKSKTIAAGLTVAVSPGAHKIIVTSKSGSLYTQNVELEPGKTVHIKPNFCD
jgi:hypothetical protein